MGFFSWKCKGCGTGLRPGECVRIAGFVGTYDGYGRVDGLKGGEFDTEGEDFPCWHERCYQAAAPGQKVDESPSLHDPDQGCGGYARLDYAPPGTEVIYFYVEAWRTESHKSWAGKEITKQWNYLLREGGDLTFNINVADLDDACYTDADFEQTRPAHFSDLQGAVRAAEAVKGYEEVYVLTPTSSGVYEAHYKRDESLCKKGQQVLDDFWMKEREGA